MNKSRRLLASCLLLFALIGGAWAQDDLTQYLVVWQKDGQKVRFELSQEPRTTFNHGQLIIKSNNKDSVTYQISDIRRYTYEGISTEIAAAAPRDLTFAQTPDGTELRNVAVGTVVRLYDATGKLLDFKTSDGSPIRFSLSSRPAGVYIVSLNDRNFKIMKR